MWALIALTVSLLWLTHWLLTNTYQYWKKRGVPGPKPTICVGNVGLALTVREHLGQIYSRMYNDYKNYLYVGFYKVCKPALLIRDVDLIKDILIKEFQSFHDNDIQGDEEEPLFGRNPFVLKGHTWKVVRSQVTSGITTGKIKNMFPLMTIVGKQLVEYLKNKPEATSQEGLEVKELSAKYTTDVVATCAFGIEGKCFTDPDPEFRRMGRKLFDVTFWNGMKFTLLFLVPSLTKFFKIKLISDEVRDWFIGTLQETIKYREKNKIVRNDYLDLLLSLKTKPGEYEFTDMDVMTQAMTFYADGFETSSVALSFALYEIAKNPHIQETLRKEIDTIKSKTGGELTYEAILEMNYLDMVISETLRKYPPGLFLAKLCTKQFILPSPGGEESGPKVIVEPDTPVIIPVYGIHTDSKYYPNPEKFDPERFTEAEKSTRHKCAYMPFGEGPRMCLGFRFALMQIKVALVSILADFEMKLNSKTAEEIKINPKSIVLSPIGGLWLNFHKMSK